MEKFKKNKSFRYRKYWGIVLPVFVMGIRLWTASDENLKLEFDSPIIDILIIGWIVWTIWAAFQYDSFSVDLHEDKIVVDGKEMYWDEVSEIVDHENGGLEAPFIELRNEKNEVLVIPRSIDNAAYIREVIATKTGTE